MCTPVSVIKGIVYKISSRKIPTLQILMKSQIRALQPKPCRKILKLRLLKKRILNCGAIISILNFPAFNMEFSSSSHYYDLFSFSETEKFFV